MAQLQTAGPDTPGRPPCCNGWTIHERGLGRAPSSSGSQPIIVHRNGFQACLRQVYLTNTLSVSTVMEPLDALRRVRDIHPVPYAALNPSPSTELGPEGTAPRTMTYSRNDLLSSAKEPGVVLRRELIR